MAISVVLVAGAVAAAAVLSSLPPPAAALAKAGGALARVGPGRVVRTVQHNGYTLRLRVDPNRAAVPNDWYAPVKTSLRLGPTHGRID